MLLVAPLSLCRFPATAWPILIVLIVACANIWESIALATAGVSIHCIGDSHTRGILGAPWVPQLESRLGRPCANHGKDGETAYTIARRAAFLPRMQDAVVLAGTNDALLDLANRFGNTAVQRMYARGLPNGYIPGAGTFGATFRHLLDIVPASRVIVASLPPLGEAIDGEAYDVIAAYNAEIRTAVAERGPRVSYAPFAEALRARFPQGGEQFEASPAGFNLAVRDMFVNRAARALPFGPSFNMLARLRGRRVLHDQIHLSEESAATLVEVLAKSIEHDSRL